MGKQNSLGFSITDLIDDPITMIGVHGDFYGAAVPAARTEAMLAASINREHFDNTADILVDRWWDYRRMAPGHSFYLFAHHYYRAVTVARRKFVHEVYNTFTEQDDRKKMLAIVGKSLAQQSAEDIWDTDKWHVTGMWKAMLIADAFGIPYDFFVQTACVKARELGWKHIPRPAQLYSDAIAVAVTNEWEKMRSEKLFMAKHPIYSVDNYAGLELQDAYRDWLVKNIAEQRNKVTALMVAIYDRRQLTEEIALDHFSPTLVTRARLLAA